MYESLLSVASYSLVLILSFFSFDSLTSVINGFDKDGRPIIYMNPARQNTESSPRQLRHLVWCL